MPPPQAGRAVAAMDSPAAHRKRPAIDEAAPGGGPRVQRARTERRPEVLLREEEHARVRGDHYEAALRGDEALLQRLSSAGLPVVEISGDENRCLIKALLRLAGYNAIAADAMSDPIFRRFENEPGPLGTYLRAAQGIHPEPDALRPLVQHIFGTDDIPLLVLTAGDENGTAHLMNPLQVFDAARPDGGKGIDPATVPDEAKVLMLHNLGHFDVVFNRSGLRWAEVLSQLAQAAPALRLQPPLPPGPAARPPVLGIAQMLPPAIPVRPLRLEAEVDKNITEGFQGQIRESLNHVFGLKLQALTQRTPPEWPEHLQELGDLLGAKPEFLESAGAQIYADVSHFFGYLEKQNISWSSVKPQAGDIRPMGLEEVVNRPDAIAECRHYRRALNHAYDLQLQPPQYDVSKPTWDVHKALMEGLPNDTSKENRWGCLNYWF